LNSSTDYRCNLFQIEHCVCVCVCVCVFSSSGYGTAKEEESKKQTETEVQHPAGSRSGVHQQKVQTLFAVLVVKFVCVKL
jgi:hypothetical protein